jgi:hypothetical protein
MTNEIHFVVEQAGCESCARRVSSALADVLAIEEITIVEDADAAAVRAHAPASLERSAVDAALAEASSGGGHTYGVKPDSWLSRSVRADRRR